MNYILPDLPDLASRIKWARERKGWSQIKLAKTIGVDQTTVSQMEKGTITRPRNIEKISKTLDVSPAWLQFGISEIDQLSKRSVKLALSFEKLSDADKKAIETILKKF